MSPESQSEMTTETLEQIRKRVPSSIEAEGVTHQLDDADKVELAKIDNWTDEMLEQIYYIMSPMETEDAEKEKKDLLKYLNMEPRVYALMYVYAGMVRDFRNKERNSLKRINPTKRRWRTPEID